MLGGRISNQDEEDVEDELAALQAEATGQGRELPSVPNARLPEQEREAAQQPVGSREAERQAMLAA